MSQQTLFPARKRRGGDWRYGIWDEANNEFSRSSRGLPDDGLLKRCYLTNQKTGKRRNDFNKGWYQDVLNEQNNESEYEYNWAFSEDVNGVITKIPRQVALATLDFNPGPTNDQAVPRSGCRQSRQTSQVGTSPSTISRRTLRAANNLVSMVNVGPLPATNLQVPPVSCGQPATTYSGFGDSTTAGSSQKRMPSNMQYPQPACRRRRNPSAEQGIADNSADQQAETSEHRSQRKMVAGTDVGSTFTRAACFDKDNRVLDMIPLGGDDNHTFMDSLISFDDFHPLMGHAGTRNYQALLEKYKYNEITEPPYVLKHYKRYSQYSWPTNCPTPHGTRVGDDTTLEFLIPTADGTQQSIPMKCVILFHCIQLMKRVYHHVLNVCKCAGLSAFCIALPGGFSIVQMELWRRAVHAAAEYLGHELPLEVITCVKETVASAAGFLYKTNHHFSCEPQSFNVADSGHLTTHIMRIGMEGFNNDSRLGYRMIEYDSVTIFCGGHDLNEHIMREVCNQTGEDFEELCTDPVRYDELYQKVDYYKKGYEIGVTNQHVNDVLKVEQYNKMKIELGWNGKMVKVSVADLRKNGVASSSQTPIANMIEEQKDRMTKLKKKKKLESLTATTWALVSGGNSRTHMFHRMIDSKHPGRMRRSANDANSLAYGAALLADKQSIQLKPLVHHRTFGYILDDWKFSKLQNAKPNIESFCLKAGQTSRILEVHETVPELPEHSADEYQQTSVKGLPKHETILPVVRVDFNRARTTPLHEEISCSLDIRFDADGLPRVSVCTKHDGLELHIVNLWEISFESSLARLRSLNWIGE